MVPPFFIFGMPGVSEMLIVLMLGAGVGIPLGVPPQEPDPLMAKIAPDKCIYYTTWAGMADPDPGSTNLTERFLGDPEITTFLKEVNRAADAASQKMIASVDERVTAAVQHAPLFARTLLTHSAAVFVEDVRVQPPGVMIEGAAVIHLGDQPEKVAGAVMRAVNEAFAGTCKKVTIQGLECLQVPPMGMTPQVTVGRMDDYLVIGVGEQSFEGVLERAATPPPKWLTDAMATVKVLRPATFAYADMTAVGKLASQFGGPEAARIHEALGFSSWTSVVSVSGLDETGFVSRTKITSTDPDKGLGKLLSKQPLSAADLSGIPRDATLAVAARFDPREVMHEVLQVLEDMEVMDAEEVRQQLSQLQQPLGIDIEEDLLAALGDVWTIHTAPSSGGLLAGWTFAVRLKDAEKANAVQQKLLPLLQAAGGAFGGPSVRTFHYGDQVAYSLETPDDDFFVAFSWCLTKTQLVVTLLPQTLKSYLAQQKAERSVADQPAVAGLVSGASPPSALVYYDVGQQVTSFYPYIQFAAQIFAQQLKRENFDIDVTALPSLSALVPYLRPSVAAARRTGEGFEASIQTSLPVGDLGASAPILVAALVPAIQSSRRASRRMQSSNNLKQIALALHNYHDVHRSFPAAYNVDRDGKPLLSWRVQILPYIEEQALYEQFHLDEPWSSPHNRKLISKMPPLYRAPDSKADPGKTVYLGNAGKDGIFLAPKKREDPKASAVSGTAIRDIRDGTSNTIMVVEADDPAAVIWTKPDDLNFNPDNPMLGLGGIRPGGFLAALCDGSVRTIARTIDLDTLKGLFTKDGGERIGEF